VLNLFLNLSCRIRLRGNFSETGLSPGMTTFVRGLKKYGAFLSDGEVEEIWCIFAHFVQVETSRSRLRVTRFESQNGVIRR
jgi:hypothetical protein